MKFRLITEEVIPCWYELSWQENLPAIILRIHHDFLKELRIDFQNAPIVKSLMKTFKFGKFGDNFETDIGFNMIFKRQGEQNGFVSFGAQIPEVERLTGQNCPECGGLGRDRDIDMECFTCRGKGKQFIIDWSLADTISASFTVFLRTLSNCEKDTSALFPQLMIVETVTTVGRDASLDGMISVPLRRYLKSLGHHENGITYMTQAMKIAHEKMLGLRDYSEYDFQTRVHANGKFTADCPGDACGIHPSDSHRMEGEGYEFVCHNVDTAMQQITLLAGLAALHDLARKNIKI